MSNTRKFTPLQPAVAAWTVVRVDGVLLRIGRSHTAHPTVSIPICRGLTR